MKYQKKDLLSCLALLLFLLLKALFLGWYVAQGWLLLAPDEAQYWCWSRQLQLGYYSKPPAIAWQIAAGRALFADTELGVRALSIVIGFLQPLAIAAMALSARFGQKTALIAGWIWAITPLGILGSLLAITDGGMLLFWSLATLPWLHALFSQEAEDANGAKRECHYAIVGSCIALGALFKWPIYFFWVIIVLLLPGSRLSTKGMGVGIAVSLLGLLPSFYWNKAHDWATWRHVFTTMTGGHSLERGTTPLFHGNLGDFILAQSLLLTPVFALLLLFAWRSCLYSDVKTTEKRLILASFLPLMLFALIALFQKMQGNWCIFAMPQAVVSVAWYLTHRCRRPGVWLVSSSFVALSMTTALLVYPYLYQRDSSWLGYLPKIHSAPLKYQLGWNKIASALTKAGYDPKHHFLFSPTYQTTSLLSFYSPSQKQAYFFNLFGVRRNQFSYWSQMQEQEKECDGFFALIEPETLSYEKLEQVKKQLKPYFNDVHFKGSSPLVMWQGKEVLVLHLFFTKRFRGGAPQAIDHW